MEKNKLKRPHAAQAGENARKDGDSSSAAEPVDFSQFPSFYLFFYWVLFGQLVLLLLSLFGYEGLRPVIDWVASIIPSVESLRHSEVVMNKELARAHYALMWLCSPGLITAALFSPVRQGERGWAIKARARSNVLFSLLLLGVLAGSFVYIFPGKRTLGLERFAIGFALLSSFSSSIIALPFRYIRLILTNPTE